MLKTYYRTKNELFDTPTLNFESRVSEQSDDGKRNFVTFLTCNIVMPTKLKSRIFSNVDEYFVSGLEFALEKNTGSMSVYLLGRFFFPSVSKRE